MMNLIQISFLISIQQILFIKTSPIERNNPSTITQGEKSNIRALNNQNFESEIQKHEYSLILFKIAYCIPCEEFMFHFKRLEELIRIGESKPIFEIEKNATKRIALFTVDIQEYPEFVGKFKIEKSPHLMIFYKNTTYDYKSHMDSEFIYMNLIKQTSETPYLKSIKEVNLFKSKFNVTGLLVSSYSENNVLFNKASKKFTNVMFAKCTPIPIKSQKQDEIDLENYGEMCKRHFETNSESTVIIFKNFDDGRSDFDNLLPVSLLDTEKIEETLLQYHKFLNLKSFPIINPISSVVLDRILDIKTTSLIVFNVDAEKYPEEHRRINTQIKEASYELKDEFFIVVSHPGYGLDKVLRNFMGVTDKMLPKVKVLKILNTQSEYEKYALKEKITRGNLVNFAFDVVKGEVMKEGKSQPIPMKKETHVMDIVFYTFEEIVFDVNKDVLVEFYSPKCERCKYFEPTYEELGRLMEHNENLIIARYDLLNNPVNIGVKSFPDLILWPAGERKTKPIKYTFDKNLNDMILFLRKYCKYPVDIKEEL